MIESLYKAVAARAGYRCEYCRAPEALFNHRFPVDHIIPRIFGGGNNVENLALACHACNSHKYQKQMALDDVRRRLTRLYRPRQDNWETHFPPKLESWDALPSAARQSRRLNSTASVKWKPEFCGKN